MENRAVIHKKRPAHIKKSKQNSGPRAALCHPTEKAEVHGLCLRCYSRARWTGKISSDVDPSRRAEVLERISRVKLSLVKVAA